MAKKKIYAVRKGHKTGLFNTWAECQKATAGYSGAEFKSFTDKEEAIAFLEMKTVKTVSGDKDKEAAGIVEVPENMVIAYVDGSFEKSIGRYAFGCVILTPDGQEIRRSGSGSDPAGVAIRNVAGEMLGAMNAVKWARENDYPAVEIRYDYEGVEKWVTGVWRAKTPLTSKYAAHMQEAGNKIRISFCKIAAHTGNHYNEEADQLAKSALLRTDEEVSI
ncbi:MAG: ribonuclease H family protein [Blautia sp.]|mgnify:FL=1|uniref:ribonuclease H1 domain-containing protein n=1 Tax=unclassified Blautia TaxID=2648079 RepID=UPI001C0F6FFE|nr:MULTISPECIES: ribonuclease H family protein [unclassified Blautia]MBU5681518.1 ribonuclease H family protein [Blautia sp. MSJ-9]MCI6303636.1 ribonuclease H family protein [Blautia sp.]MCI7449947.1 ribonuclease H family protein [Blautia sp.]MDD6414080.1 ribonuclease H family protein [Blautia sp.]MDY4117051.1 ribonuclease H family protein [Blautia sp.]